MNEKCTGTYVNYVDEQFTFKLDSTEHSTPLPRLQYRCTSQLFVDIVYVVDKN